MTKRTSVLRKLGPALAVVVALGTPLRVMAAGAEGIPNACKYLRFNTQAALEAAAYPDCTVGYALDNDVFELRDNSAWIKITSSAGLATGGTLSVTGAATLSSTLAVTGASTLTGAAYANGGVDRSTAAGLAIGAANATSVTITPATTITGAATLSSTLGVASGVSTLGGGLIVGSTRDTGTGQSLTTASSGYLFIAAASTDAATTFVLPAASTKARYCFAADSVTGSNRELKIETPAGSDLIVGVTTAAGGTGIATTAGASHGIKNTHATAVRGNGVCVGADGTNTWYMAGAPSGTWAAY